MCAFPGLPVCPRGAVLGLLADEVADADYPLLEHNLPRLDHHGGVLAPSSILNL